VFLPPRNKFSVDDNTIRVQSRLTITTDGDFSEGRLYIDIHNGLLGESKLERFYLDVGRIIGNFHFSNVAIGTLGVNISSYGRDKFLFGRGNRTASAV